MHGAAPGPPVPRNPHPPVPRNTTVLTSPHNVSTPFHSVRGHCDSPPFWMESHGSKANYLASMRGSEHLFVIQTQKHKMQSEHKQTNYSNQTTNQRSKQRKKERKNHDMT